MFHEFRIVTDTVVHGVGVVGVTSQFIYRLETSVFIPWGVFSEYVEMVRRD